MSHRSFMRSLARAAVQAERSRQTAAQRALRETERKAKADAKQAAQNYLTSQVEETEALSREVANLNGRPIVPTRRHSRRFRPPSLGKSFREPPNDTKEELRNVRIATKRHWLNLRKLGSNATKHLRNFSEQKKAEGRRSIRRMRLFGDGARVWA